MASLSQLEGQLQHFDGKHTDCLLRLAGTLPLDGSTIDQLVSLAERSDPAIQVAATWLLKLFQSKSVGFTPAQVTRLVEQLSKSSPWENQLHLVQMLAKFSIPAACAEQLFQSLVLVLSQRNRFVRAWVYTALHSLASQQCDYASEVIPLLEQALRDEAASVRARLRQLEPLGR